MEKINKSMMTDNEFLFFINRNFKVSLDEYRLIKNILAYTKRVSQGEHAKEILKELLCGVSYITEDILNKIYLTD